MVPAAIVDLPLFEFISRNQGIRIIAEDEIYQNPGRAFNRIITADPACVFITSANSVGPILDAELDMRNRIAEWFRAHPECRLVWVSVNADTDQFVDIPNVRYYHLPEYHAVYWPIFSTATIQDQPLQRRFLSLNKRAEPVRQLLCYWAQREDFAGSFWFSYLGESDYQGELFSDQTWQRNEEILKLWHSAWPELATLREPPKRYLQLDDVSDYHRADADLDPTWLAQPNLYATSFISVVSETSMVSPLSNFSEKTFRAIMMGHPILMLGSQYSVRTLRRWGFDVYDDIINHDYDLEADHVHRARRAFAELERLNSIPLARCEQIRQDILQRRQRNIIRYRDLFYQLIIRQREILPEILEFFQARLR